MTIHINAYFVQYLKLDIAKDEYEKFKKMDLREQFIFLEKKGICKEEADFADFEYNVDEKE